MSQKQTTLAPFDQRPVVERQTLSASDLDAVIATAAAAQKSWATTPLDARIAIFKKWMAEFESHKDELCAELSQHMGRPLAQCPGEIGGTLQRARHLCKIAPDCLREQPRTDTETPGLRLAIRRVPLGVVAIVSPWNYPYMSTINALATSILSGNSVILKPSPQTPTVAERFQSTFEAAGLPKGLIQAVHLDVAMTAKLAADPRVGFLAFTGSVAGGKALDQAAASGSAFKGVGLELGGKDPAYVRPDADIPYTADQLVDGAMFNAGQSCCAVERIYVHESVYDAFVDEFVRIAKQYKLGDPSQPGTTLGPVISLASAERIRKQVDAALQQGARNLVPADLFPQAKPGTTLVAPTVLVDVDHTMDVMTEETFGPVIGIMKVKSDEEALALMNDSHYGLTASIWTNASDAASLKAFDALADALETGTVYLNRADCLEPALPWTGVKDSGRGISLSTLGYDQVTRAKSIHMRISRS
ncbi:uncharacterized protein PFL1_00705 [Pseudozyma flocculosa PF-1]|uniref:Related to aldehyde dehydrogenase n=1 Tax=Pseudozyma flocculosa TaxID=84751 RepID=A0A5C3F416_9BASI|nr:uncharacterized protein PFL1_00705 [Pseudozyma flocculosa PF-1]EPQ31370.1 hypothetical protein PFL1_00705 [Pseudozyma flocculosa PF-1]SPO38850.1 related to aldehyde dehydrogenase [Pseudozyma flocculosa]